MSSREPDLHCRHCGILLRPVAWVMGTVWVADDGEPGHDPTTATCSEGRWHQPVRAEVNAERR